MQEHKWLRKKGYLHITPQIDVDGHRCELLAKLRNKNFIAQYAFYPLIHAAINERKYKRIPHSFDRAHSYILGEKYFRTAKSRPLHYATHMDALIFGYYAEQLNDKYEERLRLYPELSDCIIAYRKIPSGIPEKNKGTMHFAKDVFKEIECRSLSDACSVLMFDIKSFFSALNHEILEKTWADLISKEELPPDHKNVFNATTMFSYILLDDLRIDQDKKGRKSGFDERRLHEIRKEGKFAFFSSPKEFRNKIKSKELKIFRFPFWDKKRNIPVGIPQGLPISAILANMYFLNFDIEIMHEVIKRLRGFYRRYSDDILIICKPEQVEEIKKLVGDAIEKSLVKISTEKTEEYLFKYYSASVSKKRLTSIKIWPDKSLNNQVENQRYACCQIGAPLTYLGFEFYGYQTLIKSSNLSKFYRRMIKSVKSRAKRAKKIKERNPEAHLAIFKNQLYKIYTLQDLTKTKIKIKSKKLIKQEMGNFVLKSTSNKAPLRSNYLSYVKNVSRIMEEGKIERQIRKHQEVFKQAMYKHLRP